MTGERDVGRPAFPVTLHNNGMEPMQTDVGELEPGHMAEFTGMLLRDYFAAKAMQSFLQHGSCVDVGECPQAMPGIAATAFAMADAMLNARSS